MRVLHVIEGLAPRYGGLSRAVSGLSEALQGKGVENVIITTSLAGDDGAFRPEGVEVQAFPRRVLRSWGYVPRLLPSVDAAVLQADLIHVHGLWSYLHFVTSRAALNAGKPYLVCPHGMLDSWALNQGRFRKRIYAGLIERQTLNRAALIHALCENEAADIRRFGITTQVVTIPNGVSQAEFEQLPDRVTFIKKYQVLVDKTIFLFLGRLHPKKGVLLLAKAFGEVARVRPDVALLIGGPNEVGSQEQMEDAMSAQGASGRYVFTGLLNTEERREALAAADVFVLPSFSEGFPIAPIEALASGLPVILTEACNIPGIEASGAGLIIKAEIRALTDAMLRLSDDGALRNEMGRKGRALVLANYTWDRIATRMNEVYRDVIRRQSPQVACSVPLESVQREGAQNGILRSPIREHS